MKQIQFNDLATGVVSQLISQKASFEVIGLGGKLLEAVRIVENKIESAGMSCRVYSVGRLGFAATSFMSGVAGAIGILSAASIAIHNLMTLYPDYEIQKLLPLNKIVVQYKNK
jgi:hypothetical protein